MKHIRCPAEFSGKEKSIFLAGGISGCADWQEEMVSLLSSTDLALFNPRRLDFDTSDLSMEEDQINWEHRHLKKSDAVSFWFPPETLCPITLFELGKILMTDKEVFIGVHPDYRRKRDIEIQTRLIRPEIKIVYSLKDLAEKIKRIRP
jgi:hypothetical protein